jgi:hypothetical protein
MLIAASVANWDILPLARLANARYARQTSVGGDINIEVTCMHDRLPPPSWSRTTVRTFAVFVVAALIALASGCAPTELSSARREMAAGQYAAARQELLAIPIGSLNDDQRREVKDDLCVSTFMAGEPAYTTSEQRRVCADAAKEPGSRSAEFVAKIDDRILQASYEKVNAALANGDLGDAEQAAQVYLSTPGADPTVVAKWSRRMWDLVVQRDRRAGPRSKKELSAAIVALRQQHPSMRKMSKPEFVLWVAKQGSVEGTPLFSSVALQGKELNLAIKRQEVQLASLKLDRLSDINDATIARCGCDGRTNVGIAETNFPLYLVRLDPETRRSEVLILPHR